MEPAPRAAADKAGAWAVAADRDKVKGEAAWAASEEDRAGSASAQAAETYSPISGVYPARA